ncbi:MAG: JAB domain-containing protein [Kiritimatiellae bacterium]|nr:JAB domain-containing protein [Kiritimatiellia bacterium]
MNYVTALIQLPLIRETRKERIRTPEDVARVCSDIRDLAQETFHVLMLNAKNNLINRIMATVGIVDASLVHPREVFRQAVAENATAVVLVHNHPSGDPTPSAEDVRVTRQIVEAGRILRILVTDHVIIGRESESSRGFLSMREQGLCDFTGNKS